MSMGGSCVSCSMACAHSLAAPSRSSGLFEMSSGSVWAVLSDPSGTRGSARRSSSTGLGARGMDPAEPLGTSNATKPRGDTLTPPISNSTRSSMPTSSSSSSASSPGAPSEARAMRRDGRRVRVDARGTRWTQPRWRRARSWVAPTCGVATAVISGGRCEVIILVCWCAELALVGTSHYFAILSAT